MQELTSLASLASEINAQANLAEACANQAVVHAARCGAALNTAKSQIPHGGWLAWLEGNCPRVTARHAQRYMRVANQYPELISNTTSRSLLPSIYSAIALLSAPEEAQSEIKEELEAGRTFTEKELLDRIKAAKEEETARLNGEKEALEARNKSWQEQAQMDRRKIIEREEKIKLLESGNATLRKSIALEAERLAEDKLNEIKIEKASVEKKLKDLRKSQAEAIERGVNNKLREQQDDVTRIENQIQALERHRVALQRQIEPMAKEAANAAHHDKHIKALDHLINQASLEIMDAFDPDFCAGLPRHYLDAWARGEDKIRQLAELVSQQLASVSILRIEKTL